MYNNILNEISCSRIIPAVTHFRHFELESFAEGDSVFTQTVDYHNSVHTNRMVLIEKNSVLSRFYVAPQVAVGFRENCANETIWLLKCYFRYVEIESLSSKNYEKMPSHHTVVFRVPKTSFSVVDFL